MKFSAGGRVLKGLRSAPVLHGAALAGGITAADALTSAAVPEPGHTRGESARKGLVKGAIYGTALAGAEPALLAALNKAAAIRRRGRAIVPLASRMPVIAFRGGKQLFTDTGTAKGVFADPLKGASGEQKVYTRDEHGNAKGGIRTPWVEVPEARYVSRISVQNPMTAGMATIRPTAVATRASNTPAMTALAAAPPPCWVVARS